MTPKLSNLLQRVDQLRAHPWFQDAASRASMVGRRLGPVIARARRTLRRRPVALSALAATLAVALSGSAPAAQVRLGAGSEAASDTTGTTDRGSLVLSGGDRNGSQTSGKRAKSSKGSTKIRKGTSATATQPPPSETLPAAPPAAAPSAPAVHQHALSNLGIAKVALTFDDGPGTATSSILTLLKQHGVKATFCVIGTKVQDHHDLIRQIVADGHTLCNHTWAHALRLGEQSPETIRADLQRTNDEIHQASPGTPIKYFRHPGGNFTPAAISVAAELGMASIGWEVDPRDWDVRNNGTGEAMGKHVVDIVTSRTRPGSIVLSHDGGGDRSGTIVAYQTLLPWFLNHHELIALPT